MNAQAAARLGALREEYESGMKMLADLRRKQDEMQATLLRISGAIQVLEELLEAAPPLETPAGPPAS